MSKLKALSLFFIMAFMFVLSSCFDNGGAVPRPTATATEADLVGHWVVIALTDQNGNMVSVSTQYQREVIVEPLDQRTNVGPLTVRRSFVDYPGNWRFVNAAGSQIELYLDIQAQDPELYIPGVWSIMSVTKSDLHIATADRACILRRASEIPGYLN